jgi:hypothetical protein
MRRHNWHCSGDTHLPNQGIHGDEEAQLALKLMKATHLPNQGIHDDDEALRALLLRYSTSIPRDSW